MRKKQTACITVIQEFHYQLREGVSRDYGVYLSLMLPGKGKAVRSYLGRKEDSLLEKHLCMLCRILGIDVPDGDMDNDRDAIEQIMPAKKFGNKK